MVWKAKAFFVEAEVLRGDSPCPQVTTLLGYLRTRSEDARWAGTVDLGDLWARIQAAFVGDSEYPFDEPYPLCRAILGGERLFGDDSKVLILVSKPATRDVAAALLQLPQDDLRRRLRKHAFPEEVVDEDEVDAVCDAVAGLSELYAHAAQQGGAVAILLDSTDTRGGKAAETLHAWLFAGRRDEEERSTTANNSEPVKPKGRGRRMVGSG